MYEMYTRIRFSETDETGRLSMSGLLRLFQDCGYFHAQSRSRTNSPENKSDTAWYLLKQHIEKYEMPPCGEEVKLCTWIYSSGASIAHKQIVLFDKFGKALALGDTMWVFVSVEDGKPALPPAGIWRDEDYGERLPLRHRLARIAPIDLNAEETEKLPDGRVCAQMLDVNRHANNVLFTEYAMVLADCSSECGFLAAEFLKQARAGKTLCPYILRDKKGKTVVVCNAEGEPYARFRFEQF